MILHIKLINDFYNGQIKRYEQIQALFKVRGGSCKPARQANQARAQNASVERVQPR